MTMMTSRWTSTWTWTRCCKCVWSLGFEVKLDRHLMRLWMLLLRMVRMVLVPQSVLILGLCTKGSGLYGDHTGGVGVYEAGEGVVG